jgi:nitrate ABC transporter ATP-binding subunit
MTVARLEVDHVTKVYDLKGEPFVAVEDIHFTVKDREFVSLLGPSGCGKSTVLSIVVGLTKPTYGGVVLDGREVDGPGPDRGVVFQKPALLPWMTVLENILFALRTTAERSGEEEQKRVALQFLELVGLKGSEHKYPKELSGGMKQRVGIARALAIDPKVLLMDEPLSALDALTRFRLQEEILRIWESYSKTVLMVTHDIDEALFLSDRVVMMTKGPKAKIKEVLEVPFERPRERDEILEDQRYYSLRNRLLKNLREEMYYSGS